MRFVRFVVIALEFKVTLEISVYPLKLIIVVVGRFNIDIFRRIYINNRHICFIV